MLQSYYRTADPCRRGICAFGQGAGKCVIVETRHALSLPDAPIINFLKETQIDDAAATGKVGFGTIYHDKKADLNKAIQVALESYIDGLFAVAIDDKIVEKLDDIVVLKEKTVITFIRLTLLIGR